MNDLVDQVEKSLDKKFPKIRFPYWIEIFGGVFFDLATKMLGKKLAISSIRIKKFCATTQFDARSVYKSGFVPPFTLSEGLHRTLYYEFLDPQKESIEFITE